MRWSKRFVDFNKQILFGEIGAVLGTPFASWLAARFTADATVIAGAAVIGGLAAGSAFWLVMKIRDEQTEPGNPIRLGTQIAFYTPAAFLLGLIVYQPALFWITKTLVGGEHEPAVAAFVGQSIAFSSFLVAINLYRVALQRVAGKQL